MLTFEKALNEAMKEEVVIDYDGESDYSKAKKTAPDNPVKDGNAKKKTPAIKPSDKDKNDQNQDDENNDSDDKDNSDDNKDDQNQDDDKDTKKDEKPKPKDDKDTDDSKGKDDDKKVNEGLRTFEEFIKK